MNIHVPINNLKLHDFVQQTADARSTIQMAFKV